MSLALTAAQVQKIQNKYYYLCNYESDDVEAPIDPLSYVDSNGDSLLHIAASAGDLETVELLLKAGIDPNQLGDMSCSALHYAKGKRHEDVALKLIEYGARSDMENDFGKLPGE